MKNKASQIFNTPEASGFDRVTADTDFTKHLLKSNDMLNTPDTEWEEYVQHAYESILFYHNPIEADKQFGNMLGSVLNTLLTKERDARDIYWKERVEELELSCIDDRLLGKTDEYLDGYNTSTQRWREQRDTLLDNLK